MTAREPIARWESRGGVYFATLYRETDGAYTYRGVDCGGCLGVMAKELAVSEMERRVMEGYFQPDVNKTPMKRTGIRPPCSVCRDRHGLEVIHECE